MHRHMNNIMKEAKYTKVNVILTFLCLAMVFTLLQFSYGLVIQKTIYYETTGNQNRWNSLSFDNFINIIIKSDIVRSKSLNNLLYRSANFSNGSLTNRRIFSYTTRRMRRNHTLPLCLERLSNLTGRVWVHKNPVSFLKIEKLYPNLQPGGRYKPPDCLSRHKVAILVPYRNRKDNLKVFLRHMHSFLQKQQLDYGIYIIEQAEGSKFNRGLLLNIGYIEALKVYDYQCFVLHDVDKLPIDIRNVYSCPSQPRHLTVAVDQFGFVMPYSTFIGGAAVLTKEQYKNVNGFSNSFFGWGAEDDDFYKRVKRKGYDILRYSTRIARYVTAKHGKDKGNEINPNRFRLVNQGRLRYDTDGLNSAKYDVISLDFYKLYTRINVKINETEISSSV